MVLPPKPRAGGPIYASWGNQIRGALKNAIYPNLMLWLPMDEGEGNTVYDNSGEGNDGVVYGCSWVEGCGGGFALGFDGIDDYAEIPESSSLVPSSSDFTVCIKLKVPSPPSGTNIAFPFLWVKVMGSNVQGIVIDIYPAGYVCAYLQELSGTNIFLNSLTDVCNGEWRSVALRRKGTLHEVFVDGELKASGSTSSVLNFSQTAPITLGKPFTGYSYWYVGSLDDVRVYFKALSLNEIREIVEGVV